jgi:general secretion pathway protein I
MGSDRSQQAFTLLEVMVALAIVSLSLAGVAGSMGQMIDTANAMRDRTYASWIAQNKITEYRIAGVLPDVGESSGEIDYANTTWAWTAEISETGIENLMKIDVSVLYPGADDAVRTVTGFIGEPLPPGQANAAWTPGPAERGERR